MLESAISRRGVRLLTLSQLAKMWFHEVFLTGACHDIYCDICRKGMYIRRSSCTADHGPMLQRSYDIDQVAIMLTLQC